MSRLTASLTALDAVATGVKTWLSRYVDLTHLTTFEDEALGREVVAVINAQVGKGEVQIDDDRWHPWPEEAVPGDLRGEFLSATLMSRSGHRFVAEVYLDADGMWRNSGTTNVVAWRRPFAPWVG